MYALCIPSININREKFHIHSLEGILDKKIIMVNLKGYTKVVNIFVTKECLVLKSTGAY